MKRLGESEDVVLLSLNCQVGIWRKVGKRTSDDDGWRSLWESGDL